MRKKLLLLGVVFVVGVLCTSPALAFDPVGPLGSQLKQGETSIGVEWVRFNMDVHRLRKSWSDAWKDAEVQGDKIFLNLAYGPSDDWDVFFRIGAVVSPEYERSTYDETAGDVFAGDGDTGLALGGGVKVTFWRPSPDFVWGAVAQVGWMSFEGTVDSTYEDERRDFDLDFLQTQLMTGPTWTVSESARVYGGVGYHHLRGYVTEDDGDYRYPKAHTQWGSFSYVLGAVCEIDENCSANVEYICSEDSEAVGAGLFFRF